MAAIDGAVWFGVSLVTFLGDPLVIGGLGLAACWRSSRLAALGDQPAVLGDRPAVLGDRPAVLGDWLPGIGDRSGSDRGALLFATIVGGLALSAALKTGFGLARPSGAADLPGVAGMPDVLVPIYTWIVGPGGHAFPSGHATAATLGWVGLAWAASDDRRHVVLAGGLVAAIATSRVALGVHRPHEVLAGITVGLAVLLVGFVVLGTPRRTFALAGVIGVSGAVIVGLTGYSLLIAGVALGTAVGWELARDRDGLAVTPAVLSTVLAVGAMAGTAIVRSGALEGAVALVGVGGGAAMVTGRRVLENIESE